MGLYYAIVSIVLPFVTIIWASSITFSYLRKTQTSCRSNKYQKSKNLFQITLLLNLFFFFSNFPPFIISIIYTLLDLRMTDLVYNTLLISSYLYYSCDFFIYLIANRLFRETCFSLCRKKTGRRHLG